jgi:hypothetical protein
MDAPARNRWMLFAATLAIVLVVQSPLVFNPGYFSHDELQWAYYATRLQGGFFGNALWTDVHAFQYRPLTFSLWVLLSRNLFEHPYAFHAVIVTWGAANAGLMALLLRRYGVTTWGALAAALVFALGPYAAYVHGWVGTIADLIWMSCTLLIGLLAKEGRRPAWVFAGVFALTSVALLAKEASIVIPALVLLAWWYSGRQRAWGVAAVASAAPVLLYLLLRLKAILFASEPTGAIYHWSLLSIPARWLEYQLFPVLTSRLGAGDFLVKGLTSRAVVVAAVMWLLLAWSLGRAGLRWLLAFLLGGAAALGPVLLLAGGANQYGYGFAAVTAGVVALAWGSMQRAPRVLAAVIACLCVWHGVNIMRSTHDIGVKQSRFSPALAKAVASSPTPVRVRPLIEKDRWIYLRLTHEIPSYRGVPIGDRVQLVEADEPMDYLIGRMGELLPAHP